MKKDKNVYMFGTYFRFYIILEIFNDLYKGNNKNYILYNIYL